uniref:Uncharacterized protein n=1 Tax=Accipiter nisus TaxID=211598 RepID=A0A8B9MHA3_9AVES
GREKEIDLFGSCLKAYEDLGQSRILAFEGTMGSGKSHLLTELAYLDTRDSRVACLGSPACPLLLPRRSTGAEKPSCGLGVRLLRSGAQRQTHHLLHPCPLAP